MPQAAIALLVALSSATGFGAARKFTVVIDGKINSEDAIDSGSGWLVEVKSVADLARASSGSLAVDAEGGVVSILRAADRTTAPVALSGFKGSAITFVVDGRLLRVPVKLGLGGVPYLAPKDLKTIAESLGFAAELDEAGSVLALTRKGVDPAPTSSAASARVAGESVCVYLDRMKSLWLETEPSRQEKETFDHLAKYFEENKKKVLAGGKVKANPADLQLLESTLKGFAAKVDRRFQGTKNSAPPPAAKEWYAVSVDFLDKMEAAVELSLKLIDEYKLSPDKQPKKEAIEKQHARLVQLNTQIQAVGTQEIEVVVRVREDNGCGAP